MKKQSNFIRMLKLSEKGRASLFIAVFLVVINGVLSVFPYYLCYIVASDLLGYSIYDYNINILILWLLTVLVLKAITAATAGYLSHHCAYDILLDIRIRVVEKMAKLPLGYFFEHPAGKIRKTIVDDVEKLEKFFAHHICDFVKIIVMPITAFIILLKVNIILSFIFLIPLLLGVILQVLVFKSYNSMMDEYYHYKSQISKSVIEYIRGMPVVKLFNKTTQTFLKFNQTLNDYKMFWMQFVKKSGFPFVGFSICSDSGFLFALPLGIIMVASSVISVPGLFLLLSVGVSYTMFIPILGQVASVLSINLKNLDGVYSILDTPSLDESDTVKAEEIENYDIGIESVTFAYEKGLEVLKNINIKIKEGETVAFVGPSGAGKSTMANLIARFYDPDHGKITLSGIDIRDMSYNSLMDHVSYLFQENFTFADTVFENIRMYNKEITKKEVIKVAKLARADEFIRELTNGYDTLLGSEGTYLSGGQVQRINIARAIIKNSPIVILDEATAFTDPENENLIQKGLNELLRGKTVIVIAHRLRTIRHASNIYVFNQGEIVESGSFEQLIALDGLFSSMWQSAKETKQWKFTASGGTHE